MLHIFVLTVTLAVATAVPSRDSHEESELVDLRYGGPSGILRFADEHADSKDHGMLPDIEAQKKIIEKTYSPAFLQPIWVLDYRLTPLKGRHYKTKFGSHVVILPKDTRQHGPDVHYFEDDKHHDHEHHRNEHNQELEMDRLRQLAMDHKHDGRRVVHKHDDEHHDHEHIEHQRNEHSQEHELNRLRELAMDHKNDGRRVVHKHDDEHIEHQRNEHSQKLELNRLRQLAMDHKHDGRRVVHKHDDEHHDHRHIEHQHNEPSQELEFNRLRHLAMVGKHDRRPVVHKLDDDKGEHTPHHGWGKGYNPGWAMLPDVKFAGRNHH